MRNVIKLAMVPHLLKSHIGRCWHRAQGLCASAQKHWRHAYCGAFLVGLISLIWFAFRTGTKPSRAAYPCQRVAAANGYLWVAIFLLPIFSAVRHTKFTSRIRDAAILAVVAALVIPSAFLALDVMDDDSSLASAGQAVDLTLEGRLAGSGPASDIFAVSRTSGNGYGVAELIELMGSNGTLFYRSDVEGENKGPSGLISRDDTIIIKPNGQWAERGGTNTDLVKALIEAITQHPDVFTGEIIVAENGQGRGSFTRSSNNAEDISQSVQKVVDSFPAYRVSTYLWDTITTKGVNEYSEGNLEDGYVLDDNVNPRTDLIVSYPKFKTKFGTHVSFKLGIWNPETQGYDSEHLKVINVPVLKSHGAAGVTASIKHCMGILSVKLTSDLGRNPHDSYPKGGWGTQWVETRLPTLNVLDAIWINAIPLDGPGTPYADAAKTRIIAASADPVALDYWAAKNILVPTARVLGYTNVSSMNPDNTVSGSFGHWLRLSMEEIVRAGYDSTVDEARMNVFVSQLETPAAPTLVSPANGAAVSGTSLTFEWSPVTGAEKYRLLVSRGTGVLDTTKYKRNIELVGEATTTYVDTGYPANGTKYYWWVWAYAPNGNSSELAQVSANRRYFTNVAGTSSIAAPTLVSPANGAAVSGTSVTFEWSPVTGAVKYKLLVSRGTGILDTTKYKCNVDLVDAGSGLLTTYVDTGYQANGVKYYWWVWAYAADGSSSVWAQVSANGRNFTNVGGTTSIAAPTLVLPADAASVSGTSVTFQWNPVAGAVKYKLLVSRSTGILDTTKYKCNVDLIDLGSGLPTTYVDTGYQANGVKYYWWVWAYNSDGTYSVWSQVSANGRSFVNTA